VTFAKRIAALAQAARPVLIALLALCGAAIAHAQTYPSKPIRIIVPFVPGGGSDTIARGLASGLNERLGQPVVVENRGGANTIIGTEYVANSPADGYTLLLCTGSFSINPSLYKINYDPVKSFTPVSMFLEGSLLLVVHPSLPVTNVRELIALAKARPGELTFSSYGTGSPAHLAGELMKSMAGIDMLHIPFKGSVPAISEVVSGRVSMSFAVMTPVISFVQSGRLRALGTASRERSLGFKEFPTIAESGLPGFEASGWNGICAPGGLPKEILARLHGAIVDTFATEEARNKFIKIGFNMLPRPTSPDEFSAMIRAEIQKWAKVVKDAGIKVE